MDSEQNSKEPTKHAQPTKSGPKVQSRPATLASVECERWDRYIYMSNVLSRHAHAGFLRYASGPLSDGGVT